MSDTILLIEARQLAEPIASANDNWDTREALIAFGEEYINRLIAKGELRRVVQARWLPNTYDGYIECSVCHDGVLYTAWEDLPETMRNNCPGCGNPISE